MKADAEHRDVVLAIVFADRWSADQQARWLEKVLAEEHDRDKMHPDRIELPE